MKLRLSLLCGLTVAVLCAHGSVDYTTPYAFTTLAGISSIGSQDGIGTEARLYGPQDITTDAERNVFIVDEGNHTIRMLNRHGQLVTLAGLPGVPGAADGTGSEARFNDPQGIVADRSFNLFVADTGNHTIRKIRPGGIVTTFAGLAGNAGNADGTGGSARFNRPRKIAIDASGNLFVTEAGNNDVRKITPAGVVTTLASNLSFPEASDLSAMAPISYGSIAVDGIGNVYVCCFFIKDSHTGGPRRPEDFHETYIGYVYKIGPDGTRTWLWQTDASHYLDGRTIGASGSSLTFDTNGQLIVGDNYKIYRYDPASGSLLPIAGDGSRGDSDGTAASAKLGFPLALAYDNTGILRIADAGNNVIRQLASGTVTTIAGVSLENATRTLDGKGAAARLTHPMALAADGAGNIYVADYADSCIRKITADGTTTTFAGTPAVSGATDGMGVAARFNHPEGIAVDTNGNVYVADTYNSTIRKITPDGTVTTLAGQPGLTGSTDGKTATFNHPVGIAVDPAGIVFVADSSNHLIRKITSDGVTSTFAGQLVVPEYLRKSTDGVGAAAVFEYPLGLTLGPGNSLYVVQTDRRIRKITMTGEVTTLVSPQDPSYADGVVSGAGLSNPWGIAADTNGNLYVTDAAAQTVRKITSQGIVSTLGGLFDAPGSTDGAGRDARFYYPRGIAIDPAGNLYVTSGTTVRQGRSATAPEISTQPTSQTATAGSSISFSVAAVGIPTPTYQWYFNGSAISGATYNTLSVPNVRTVDAGDYTVTVTNAAGSVTSAKATLTVNTPPPPPASSGGGGGAVSWWALAALLVTGGARWLTRFRPVASS